MEKILCAIIILSFSLIQNGSSLKDVQHVEGPYEKITLNKNIHFDI